LVGLKPNVILITTDQQRKDSLGCYGSTFVQTPNLDQMAKEGVLFDRAYATSPVCTPSRASLYSGKYVGVHGAWNVGTKIPEDEILLPHIYKNEGYTTYHIGKAHFQPYGESSSISMESVQDWEKLYPDFCGPYYGFDNIELCMGHSKGGIKGHYGAWVKSRCGTTDFTAERKADMSFGGEAYDWDLPSELSNTSWVEDRASAFLHAQVNSNKPFFLSLGFQDPHHPHALPVEDTLSIEPDQIPLPAFQEGELSDKPPFFQDVHTGAWSQGHALHGQYPMAGQGGLGCNYSKVSPEDERTGKAYYYRMVEMIDKAMGGILKLLDELGLAENTVVVVTSDHGELLGDHGIWMKGPFHYEQLINVPLIMQWKGTLAANSTSAIVSLVDIAPTLLSLCGIEVPKDMNGKSLQALLDQQVEGIREFALVESVDDPGKIRAKTLVSQRYKLTYYQKQTLGELYDLQDDPKELVNLWNSKDHQDVKSDMLLNLLQELEHFEKKGVRYCYA
jgi:arylsulfatase A-like enzyme